MPGGYSTSSPPKPISCYGTADHVVDKPGHEIERYFEDIADCPGPDEKVRDAKTKYQKYSEQAMKHEVWLQSHQFKRRASMEQWCDENEREWHAMDTLFRRRLIGLWSAVPRELPEKIEYPFAKATQQLRDLGEQLNGDEKRWGKLANRGAAQSEHMITQVVHPEMFPPRFRILYFTQIFGSERSFNGKAWAEIEPLKDVDIWMVSWNGYSDFEQMIHSATRMVRSFADSVTNVFYGHSMGAIVAYEVIKRLESEATPHRPSALVVSACPAPHLFPRGYQSSAFEWLSRISNVDAFNKLTEEQHDQLKREHGVAYKEAAQTDITRKAEEAQVYDHLATKLPEEPWIDDDMKKQLISDMKCMKSYESWRVQNHGKRSQEDLKVYQPIYVFGAPNDDFVEEEDMEAWSGYTKADFEFKMLKGKDDEEEVLLDERLHAFGPWGPKPLLNEITRILMKYEHPNKWTILPDIGPTDGQLPDFVECVVVGAGICGVNQMRRLNEHNIDAICVDQYHKIGGVWIQHSNTFSRVNTSEAAYRIVDQGDGPLVRTNEDHSPSSDIAYDIYSVAAKHGYGKFRVLQEVVKVTKNESGKGRYTMTFTHKKTAIQSTVKTDGICWAVNRRLGKKRHCTWSGEEKFRGEVYYGFGNEVKDVDWRNKKVLVVGCGAFAFENMRTALEHGARHASIVCRRRGTVCPKWIDVITFYRPMDEDFRHPQAGDISTFSTWNQLYLDANAAPPECWKEGLLKPNGHTVSVSDVFYQASRLGMADCKVTEIQHFRNDGYGAKMTDGKDMDFDILIKCTGFYINKDVVNITGQKKMHPNSFMDVNMIYIAEPLLDAAQFGSPFGSSYVGGMCNNVKMFAKFFKQTEWQEQVFPLMHKECPVDEQWASHIFTALFKDDVSYGNKKPLPAPRTDSSTHTSRYE